MTNFSPDLDIIDRVFERLDEKHLSRLIDEKVDRAAATFQSGSAGKMTHSAFIKLTGQFVRDIYKKAAHRRLSGPYAEAEALALLANGYPNASGDGFSAAYLDGIDDIVTVLVNLAEIIKTEMRSRYIRWVCRHYLAGLSWPLKCDLVDRVKSRWPFLPESIQSLPSGQLANHIDELMIAVAATQHAVEGWMNTGEDPLA